MKKIYLIFVILFMLMFITSCSYNPPVGATEKHHTYEEVLEYAKTIDPNATVNDEYEDTKLENVAADEYREWNAIINGIECHVASTPIIVMNEGVAGGEFPKQYFVVNTDYNFYLLKSIIESKYLDFTIVEDDIADLIPQSGIRRIKDSFGSCTCLIEIASHSWDLRTLT